MSPESIARVPANSGDVQQLLTRALPWTAALVVALVLLVVVGYYRRRRRRGEKEAAPMWTLQELREMHARGDLAGSEYERLKARLFGEFGATANAGDNAAKGSGGPQREDDKR